MQGLLETTTGISKILIKIFKKPHGFQGEGMKLCEEKLQQWVWSSWLSTGVDLGSAKKHTTSRWVCEDTC